MPEGYKVYTFEWWMRMGRLSLFQISFSNIFFPPIVSRNVPSEISNIISRGCTHDTVWHCQSSFRPRLTLDAKRKTKGKPENLSRVCGLGSCRIVICAVQSKPQKRMDRVGLVHCCGRFDCPYTSSTISSVNRSVTAIRTDCDTTASAWCRRDYCYLQNSVLKVLYIFTHKWDRGGKVCFFSSWNTLMNI